MNLATQSDFQFVENMVTQSKSSFAMGMKALPRDRRGYLFAIYAYCRILDDIADEAGLRDQKLADLDLWKKRVDNMISGKPECEITRVLHDAMQNYDLPHDELYQVIEGMKADVLGPIQAPTWPELQTYCRQVAVSVGLLSLPVFGRTDDLAKQFGVELGHALQLTNILRDVSEDSLEGRLYLPRELLEKNNISYLAEEAVTADLSNVMAEVANKAQEHYENADRILSESGSKNLQPALLMMAVYRKLFEKMQRRGWHKITPRMRLSTTEKAFAVMKYLTWG